MSGFLCHIQNNEFNFMRGLPEATLVFDRYQIIFVGEIYNKAESLKGRTSSLNHTGPRSNEEVIATLYHHFKEKALLHLRGMFAFALYDKSENTLFAGRDPFGIMPLFYKEKEHTLLLATNKSFLIGQEDRHSLSQTAIQHYFSFQYVPEAFSLHPTIKTVAPGHYLKKTSSELMYKQYVNLSFQPVQKSVQSFTQATRQVLEHSVRKHVRNEQSIGAFLSGGIDSTSIVALAKRYNPKIKTFTVGFEREGYSEIEYAEETAHALGVTNIHKVITPKLFSERVSHFIQHCPDLIADPAAIPLSFAAEEAQKHVDIVLTGEGADELFGGYSLYREPYALRLFRYLPASINKILNRLSQSLPTGMKGKDFLWRGTTPLHERYIGNAKIFTEEEKRQFMKQYTEEVSFTDVTKSLFERASKYDDSLKMQYIDLHTWLSGDILATANHVASIYSLQLRFPFLDYDVFRLARQLPTEVKLTKGTTKYVFRKAMEGIVPSPVLFRKKLGFPVPLKHWLRDELYDWAKTTIVDSRVDDIIDRQAVLHLLDTHAIGKHDYSRKVWTILIFLIWHKWQIEKSNEQAFQLV